MKTFKIYGEPYTLQDTVDVAIDGYAYKGQVTDEMPRGKSVGYVQMSDGSVVECYKSFNPLVIVAPVLAASVVGAGVFMFLMYGQPKDVVSTSGAEIKTGVDKNVVSYNGFSAIRDNSLLIDFQNGDYEATIQISGEGVDTEVITVAPGEYVPSVPVTFTTKDGLVDASITISTATSSISNEIVVEIPENTTPNSNLGLEGNWRGEYIYGVQ